MINRNWQLTVTTNNQDYTYPTGIRVNPNEWNKLNLRYHEGSMSLNGYVCHDIIMDTSGGDDWLTTINHSNGESFKGYMKNVRVYDYFDL